MLSDTSERWLGVLPNNITGIIFYRVRTNQIVCQEFEFNLFSWAGKNWTYICKPNLLLEHRLWNKISKFHNKETGLCCTTSNNARKAPSIYALLARFTPPASPNWSQFLEQISRISNEFAIFFSSKFSIIRRP